jgi:hypothetical protein
MKILRKGQEQVVYVHVAELKAERVTAPLPPEPLGSQSLSSLGLNSCNGGPKGKR